jgi:hypothetical protein
MEQKQVIPTKSLQNISDRFINIISFELLGDLKT